MFRTHTPGEAQATHTHTGCLGKTAPLQAPGKQRLLALSSAREVVAETEPNTAPQAGHVLTGLTGSHSWSQGLSLILASLDRRCELQTVDIRTAKESCRGETLSFLSAEVRAHASCTSCPLCHIPCHHHIQPSLAGLPVCKGQEQELLSLVPAG